ncbi:MAG: hypothetical protein O2968_18640, partial [Acidobacteria bacterium]|nr:hypothetical protein [Acidobacteriota bacterium]
LQDHLVLETLPPFRIILHWTTLTERDYQNADLTQSVVTLLESIAPMKNEDGQSDPSDLPIAEALQFYAETPAQAANQEAAK